MKKSLWSLGAGAVFSLAISSVAVPGVATAQVNLPTADCGPTGNCLVFDDFTVYSLPLLQDLLGNNTPYDFVYKPNEAIVNVIDRAGSSTSFQGSGTLIDGAFRAMEGGSSQDNMRFVFAGDSITTGNGTIPSDTLGGPGAVDNTQTYPLLNSSTFTGQSRFGPNNLSQFKDQNCYASMNNSGCMQSWDASVSSLLTALGGSELFFMFNNNETGDSGTLAGQDLLAWGRVTLFNADGTKITFELSGNNTALAEQRQAQTTGIDDILPTASDLWARVHSEICVNDTTNQVVLAACTQAQQSGGWHTVNQSLGGDEAGFAIFSDALNAALYSGMWQYMAIDIRFSHLNNGGDDVWIMAGKQFVPEPTSTALLGLGLLSLVALRRRNTRRS